MARGPEPGKKSRIDFLAKARAAWGDAIPAEVVVLGQRCTETTAKAVAERLGYSSGLVSGVLGNSYHGGNLSRVFQRIRECLMDGRVVCPQHGEISRARCASIQSAPYSPTDPSWARMLHACGKCPNRASNGGRDGE